MSGHAAARGKASKREPGTAHREKKKRGRPHASPPFLSFSPTGIVAASPPAADVDAAAGEGGDPEAALTGEYTVSVIRRREGTGVFFFQRELDGGGPVSGDLSHPLHLSSPFTVAHPQLQRGRRDPPVLGDLHCGDVPLVSAGVGRGRDQRDERAGCSKPRPTAPLVPLTCHTHTHPTSPSLSPLAPSPGTCSASRRATRWTSCPST